MATVTVNCPACKKSIKADEKYLNQKVKCPHCRHPFTFEVQPVNPLDFSSPATTTDKPKSDDKATPTNVINWGVLLRKLGRLGKIVLYLIILSLVFWMGRGCGSGSSNKPGGNKPGAFEGTNNVTNDLATAQAVVKRLEQENKILLEQQQKLVGKGGDPTLPGQLAKAQADLKTANDNVSRLQGELELAKKTNTGTVLKAKFKSDMFKDANWSGSWGKKDFPARATWTTKAAVVEEKTQMATFEGTFEHRGDGKFTPLFVKGKIEGNFNLVTGELRVLFVPEDMKYSRMSVTVKATNEGGTQFEGKSDLYSEIFYKIAK